MTDLIGWWPLHRDGGDAVDLSPSKNHGSPAGGVTRGVAGRGGLQAASFDGTDDQFSLTDGAEIDAPDRVSIGAWIRWRGDSAGSEVFMFDNFGEYAIGKYTNDEASFYYENTEGWWYTNYTFPVGEWFHLMFTYDGSERVLYINGSQQDTLASSGTFTSDASGVAIGGAGDGSGKFFDGQMCDFRIYNRALSAAEVQRIYEWGAANYASPPTADFDADALSYWSLDEDPANTSTAVDSWSGNDGTIYGATQASPAIRGTGMSFDGSGDRIDCGSIWPETDTFTLAIWGNADSYTTNQADYMMGHETFGTTSSDESAFLRVEDFDGDGVYDATFGVKTDGSGVSASVPAPPAGEWFHYAGTYDGSTMRFYINGELQATASESGTVAQTNGFRIGNIFADGLEQRHWTGKLDDARLYTRALSSAEVHQVYRYGTRGRDLRARTVNAR